MSPRLKTTKLVLGVALVALLGAGVITARAMGGDTDGPHGAAGHASRMGYGGPADGAMGMPGFLAGRMLDRVNATEAQRTEINRILAAARTDMDARRVAQRGLRDEAASVFTQPVVDAAAAEALRQKMLVQHDEGSQRMLQAALEASRVLSVEQRQSLATLMQQSGGRHPRPGEHRREHPRGAPDDADAPAPQGS